MPPQPTAESLPSPAATVEVLRQARQAEAAAAYTSSLRRTVHSIGNPTTAFTRLHNGLASDIGVLRYDDMLAIEALGQDVGSLAEAMMTGPREDDMLFETDVEGQHITATQYGRQGVTIRLATSELEFSQASDVASERIAQRVLQSPGHVALHALEASLRTATGEQPTYHQTDYFDPNSDSLGTRALLQSAGMLGYSAKLGGITRGSEASPVEEVAQYFASTQGSSLWNTHEDEAAVYYRTQQQDKWVTLIADKATGQMALGFEPAEEHYYYAERADQLASEKSVPFIETRAGEELLSLLDTAGLMLHPNIQAELVRVGEADRYGSVYTQMSREIAKWVNRDGRRNVTNLFVPFDAALRPTAGGGLRALDELKWSYEQSRYDAGDNALHAERTYVQERLLALDATATSEPTKVLIGLAQASFKRDAQPNDTVKELPVTASDIEIRSRACFDVAAYYLGAANEARVHGDGLRQVNVSGVPMLEKTHGSHTFMLQEGAVLHGVLLPKGTLMQRGADGGWAMLRLTPFCFDNPEDQVATGSELAKAYANETRAIANIGGASLAHIIAASTPRSRGWFGAR